MSRYLDPRADVVFKKIFGEHPNLLISFLNAILPLKSDAPIIALDYLPHEQVPEIPEFKYTVADVKCTDAKGRIFIVEMQMNWTNSFKQRLLFGSSQAFVKQLEKGKEYKFLQPVYGLGLVGDIYEPEMPEWYHHYKLVEQDSTGQTRDIIEHLQLIFIELPKFPIHSRDEKRLRILWLRFLCEVNENTKNISEDLLEIPEIVEAIRLSEEAAYSPGELNLYHQYWDSVSTEKTRLLDKYTEGHMKGHAEGHAEGSIETKHSIAKKMLLSKEFSLDAIAEITGLLPEELVLLENTLV